VQKGQFDMIDRGSPSRGRPALTGWAAAALAVSGSLVLTACAGDTVEQPGGNGGGSDAGSEASIIGGGICAVWVDAALLDAAADAAETDAAGPDAVSDDAQIDAPYMGGICATTVP
jgi:hypothetical protein